MINKGLSGLQQLKAYASPTAAKDLLLNDIYKIIESYLNSDKEWNLKVLQVSIIAIYNLHSKLNDSNYSNILLDIYHKDNKVLALYNQLIDNCKLTKICQHLMVNPLTQIISTYIPFKIHAYTNLKNQFTETATKLINKISEKSDKNIYNLAKNINIPDIQNIANKLLRYLEADNNKNIDKDSNNTESNTLSLINQMVIYFNLPIITKYDIEYFLTHLLSILNDLKPNLEKCLKSKNSICSLNSGWVENMKTAIQLDTDNIVAIGKYLKKLTNTLTSIVKFDENKDFPYSYKTIRNINFILKPEIS